MSLFTCKRRFFNRRDYEKDQFESLRANHKDKDRVRAALFEFFETCLYEKDDSFQTAIIQFIKEIAVSSCIIKNDKSFRNSIQIGETFGQDYEININMVDIDLDKVLIKRWYSLILERVNAKFILGLDEQLIPNFLEWNSNPNLSEHEIQLFVIEQVPYMHPKNRHALKSVMLERNKPFLISRLGLTPQNGSFTLYETDEPFKELEELLMYSEGLAHVEEMHCSFTAIDWLKVLRHNRTILTCKTPRVDMAKCSYAKQLQIMEDIELCLYENRVLDYAKDIGKLWKSAPIHLIEFFCEFLSSADETITNYLDPIYFN